MDSIADLRVALRRLLPDGAPAVREVVPITTLPSGNGGHASFRISLADGSRFKLRRIAESSHADRLLTLAPLLPTGDFNRIRAVHGRLLLEDWVDGVDARQVVADGGPPLVELAERCGEILGRLHSVAISGLPGELIQAARISSEGRAADVKAWLDGLAGAALIRRSELNRLIERATACVPADPPIGLVHRDLAPENVVVDADGQPVLVDNLTLTVGALDGDLARVWYRWPMDTSVRAAFDGGYERFRSATGFRDYFDYWAVATLAEAATYRHTARTGGLEAPLARLRELARGPRAGVVARPAPVTTRTFSWRVQTFPIHSSSSALLEHLEESLCPWFAIEPGSEGNRASLVVDVVLEARAEHLIGRLRALAPARVVDAFALDSRTVRLPAWESGGGLRMLDAELGVVFERHGRHVRIVSPQDGAGARVAAMRVLREATSGPRVAGDRLIHSAGLAVDGAAWLVGGRKGAGKTTLLLHLLRVRGSNFLANDRVLLDDDGGQIVASGVPSIVSIKPGTIELLGPLGQRIAASPYHHAWTIGEAASRPAGRTSGASLTPAQLLRLTGTAAVTRAPVAAVLLPVLDHNIERFEPRLMTREEAIRGATALRFGSPDPLGDDPFTGASRPPESDILGTLAQTVPWVEVRVSAGAMSEYPAVITDAVTALVAVPRS